MKAKIIETGEIKEIKEVKLEDRYILPDYIEIVNEIDWEQRRFELLKIVTQGYLARVNVLPVNFKERKIFSELVLDTTDAVIAKLKEK